MFAAQDSSMSCVLPSGFNRVCLVPIASKNPPIELTINDLPITIGRSPDADIHLKDRWASRIHCEISATDEGIVVRDLESRNGTYVNRKPIIQKLLTEGDELNVGLSAFEVQGLMK